MKPKFRTILVVCISYQFIAIPTQATTTTTTNPTTTTTAGIITTITDAKAQCPEMNFDNN